MPKACKHPRVTSSVITRKTSNNKTKMTGLPNSETPRVTPFQEQVYRHLVQIPRGRVTSYAALARALSTSPRAVGNALRRNPFAPRVPCHRVIASTGFIGGFLGEWEKAPSGVNQVRKRALLEEEGVRFDEDGMIVVDKSGEEWVWEGFREVGVDRGEGLEGWEEVDENGEG